VFAGGNGHSAARLARAREELALQRARFDLVELLYPGFERRPRADSLESFLDALSEAIREARHSPDRFLLYGTGIGGLLLVCLRARGDHLDAPLLLQAPVLWGLERRRLPSLLRLAFARAALHALFANRLFQAWFERRYFMAPLSPECRTAFFEGYAQCGALPDLFHWLGPALLRRLEASLAARPEALERVSVWWGGRDRVVSIEELRLTERALGVRWPVTTFPAWGHYPMIDAPDEWVRTLATLL
jgi:pimeloyl-ACP methyl ester carboxylesterase